MKLASFNKFEDVSILDWNFLEPATFLTSKDIELQALKYYNAKRLNVGRLEELTGVETRGVFNEKTMPSSIAAKSSQPIISRNNKDEIDLLIYAGVSRDQLEPSTACRVHHLLELEPNCESYDVSNACLGMITATNVAAKMIEAGVVRTALICSAENSYHIIRDTLEELNLNIPSRQEAKKLLTSLTLGSGGFSWLLGRKTSQAKANLSFISNHTSSGLFNLCVGDGTREKMWMRTDSTALLKEGLESGVQHWNFLKSKTNWMSEFKEIYFHQVGKQFSSSFADRLGLTDLNIFNTFKHYGNMGSISLPYTFMKGAELKNKEYSELYKSLLIGIGSGLNTTALGVEVLPQ